jgi:HNH endonuclease
MCVQKRKKVYVFGEGWGELLIKRADRLLELNQATEKPAGAGKTAPRTLLNDLKWPLRWWIKVAKVVSKPETYCWLWIKSKSKGYGYYCDYVSGKQIRVHCKLWELDRKREIPKGMIIHHLCEQRACCNPSHLRLRSPEKHTRDHMEKRKRVPSCDD